MLMVGLVVVAALVASQAVREPEVSASVSVAAAVSPVAVAPSLASPAIDAMVEPASPPDHNAAASVPAPSAVARKGFEMPDLTRRLPEDGAAVKIGDREWRVLGSREAVSASGKQAILVLRDELSGQLDYRQSALRFVLNEGQDYESFIRSRGNATRLFANPLYGDIGVDAANIAAEYTALASDVRVNKVIFIPLEVKPKAR